LEFPNILQQYDLYIYHLEPNLKQGSNEVGQQNDFDRLKELLRKKINGTITTEEKQEVKQ
jgi:hypothetical protein